MLASPSTPQAAVVVAVVDDDSSMREAFVALLEAAGFESVGYASGLDLLADLETSAPACVVLDLEMPEMDGLEVQRRLAENGNLPVIFVSGAATTQQTQRALDAGALCFLHKPIGADAFLDAVSDALTAA